MIHGYHVIFGAYGFWLPNDPRGSWSDFVGAWELLRFGKATKSIERAELTAWQQQQQQQQREQARKALKYAPVQFSGVQARAVSRGFANSVGKSRFTLWACSILPEHVHLVIARHTYKVEQIVNLLKGEATKQLKREKLHPMAEYAEPDGRMPSPWAQREWKVFLDTSEGIDNAIRYVEDNPRDEGKPPQEWSFVAPFAGLDKGWVTYH